MCGLALPCAFTLSHRGTRKVGNNRHTVQFLNTYVMGERLAQKK